MRRSQDRSGDQVLPRWRADTARDFHHRWASPIEREGGGGRCGTGCQGECREWVRRAEEDRDRAKRAMEEAEEKALGFRKQLLEGSKVSFHRYVEVGRCARLVVARSSVAMARRETACRATCASHVPVPSRGNGCIRLIA